MERRLPAVILATFVCFAAYVLIWGALYGALSQPIALTCFLGPEVLAFSVSLRVACYRRLTPLERRPWHWVYAAVIAHTVAALLAGSSAWATSGVSLALIVASVLARLVFVLLLLAGLMSFATTPLTPQGRFKLAMDATTVVGGALMIVWYFIVGPILHAGTSRTQPVGGLSIPIYPILDLVLLVGVGTVLLRGVSSAARRSVLLLLAGTFLYLVEDLYVTWWTLQHPSLLNLGGPAGSVVFAAPPFLLAAAAAEQCRQAGFADQQRRQRAIRPVNGLPYLALVFGFGLMATAAVHAGVYPWPGLVIGSVLMTGAIALRQVAALRENHVLVVTDSLTGLANRVMLRDRLQQAFEQTTRTGRPMAVLQIDLNGFKNVNDTLGHESGDLVLVAFARALARSVRESETAARLGGDEFAVILRDVDAASAASAAERILTAVKDEKVVIAGQRIPIRASIGIALSQPDCLEPAELLHRADIAMYAAKRKHFHGWQMYDEGMAHHAEPAGPAAQADRQALAEDLVDALAGGQLRLQYQPIVSLSTRQLIAVEALVRWQHPTRGMLQPDTFIPIAEEMGVIGQLGNWVLEEACQQARQWQSALPDNRPLYLSVNCSPLHIDRGSLAADVLDILHRTHFDPKRLVLEITENTPLDEDTAIPQLVLLRSHGVRIALDDFGTGYSSLRYLTRLPIDILKLDRFFVAELTGEPDTAAVAEAVIRLGQALNLDTVAEGIEDSEQASTLARLGFANGQGFHFARPMDADALGQLIAEEVLERSEP